MPAARAAASREPPSSTRASASMRHAARASRHRPAARRSSTAPSSFRVIPTVMAPPPIGYTADQPRQPPRGSEHHDASAIRAVGITYEKHEDLQDLLTLDPIHDVDPEQGWPSLRP